MAIDYTDFAFPKPEPRKANRWSDTARVGADGRLRIMKHPTDPNPRPPATLSFGALSPALHVQLNWPQRRCRFPQRIADAITLLAVHQMASDSEVHEMRERLVKRIGWMWKNPGR